MSVEHRGDRPRLKVEFRRAKTKAPQLRLESRDACSNSPPPRTAQQHSKAALTGREWPIGAKHRLHEFTGARSIKRWPTSVRSAGFASRNRRWTALLFNDPSLRHATPPRRGIRSSTHPET